MPDPPLHPRIEYATDPGVKALAVRLCQQLYRFDEHWASWPVTSSSSTRLDIVAVEQ